MEIFGNRTTWFSLQENYDLGEDLFSSKTMTWSIQQELLEKGCWCLIPTATWQSLSSFVKKNGAILQCPDTVLWLQPKLHLLNTDLNGVNTWHEITYFYIICFLTNWHYSVEICFHFGIKYIFCAFFVFYIPSNTRENIWGLNTFYRPCWWNKTVSLTVWHVFFLFLFFQCYVQTVFWKTDFLDVFCFFNLN